MTALENEAVEAAINALKEKKERLQQELAAIEKSIKQFRSYNTNGAVVPAVSSQVTANPANGENKFGGATNVKAQCIYVLDLIGKAVKMSDIQDKYNELAGKEFSIREFVRGLQRQGIVKLMKVNGSNRLSYWVKSEWISVDGKMLRDEFKPADFDLLYGDAELEFDGL
jgi:hypothetical protein